MAGIDLGDAWADNVWESGVWADGVWAGQESAGGGGGADTGDHGSGGHGSQTAGTVMGMRHRRGRRGFLVNPLDVVRAIMDRKGG